MGEPAAKKARGGAEGLVPTIREFLPWHVIEKKMAARSQGRKLAAVDDESPDSGVYSSGEHSAANDADAAALGPSDSELTYKVYTIRDLEARGINADLSVSSTRMSMVAMAPKPTPWTDTFRAALNVLRIMKTWAFAPSPRPPAKHVLRAPIVAFSYELRQATKATEWKKVAMYVGFSVGVFLFLLFAVVTAADLTDDLKPSRSTSTASGDSYTTAILAASQTAAKPAAPAAAPSAAAPADANGDGLEVSSEPTPAASSITPAKAAPKKKAPAKKKKSGELFHP